MRIPDKNAEEKYLSLFHEQIAEWKISMPAVKPLVLDFGLDDFEQTGLIEYWIANEIEAGYCGKYLFIFDGQRCPMHRHKDKLETFHIVKGTIEVSYNDRTFKMTEGDTLLVERWKYHSFIGPGPALVLEISTPCIVSDNYFENPRIKPYAENINA